MADTIDHLAPAARRRARPLASRLAHDVGKHIARMARNLPDGEIPEPLWPLMVADLFAIDGERRASAVFRERAAPLEDLIEDPRIAECRDLLEAIDALEARVRRRDTPAVRRAAVLAVRVESLLAALHRDICRAGEGPPQGP
jgi:hypothetical protein